MGHLRAPPTSRYLHALLGSSHLFKIAHLDRDIKSIHSRMGEDASTP